MKIAIAAAAFLALASLGAQAGVAEVDQETAASEFVSTADPVNVEFELFEEGRATTLLTSGSIRAPSGEITPVNIIREEAFLIGIMKSNEGRVLVPGVSKSGITLSIDRKNPEFPTIVAEVVAAPKVTPPTRAGQTGVATTNGFTTGWPLLMGKNEYEFKANGKRYRAVITANTP